MDFIIGSERAARRNKRNSVNNRADVTIDNVLCLCSAFMAAIPLGGSWGLRAGVAASRGEVAAEANTTKLAGPARKSVPGSPPHSNHPGTG